MQPVVSLVLVLVLVRGGWGLGGGQGWREERGGRGLEEGGLPPGLAAYHRVDTQFSG